MENSYFNKKHQSFNINFDYDYNNEKLKIFDESKAIILNKNKTYYLIQLTNDVELLKEYGYQVDEENYSIKKKVQDKVS